jgi:hypothetical protein
VQCVMCCQENFPMLALEGGLGEIRVMDPKSPSRDIFQVFWRQDFFSKSDCWLCGGGDTIC